MHILNNILRNQFRQFFDRFENYRIPFMYSYGVIYDFVHYKIKEDYIVHGIKL